MNIRKIYIAPASYDGRQILRKLRLNKKFKILGFLDNSKVKKKVLYRKVIKIEKVKKTKFDNIIIGGRYYKSILKQLINLRIDKKKITLLPKSEFQYEKKDLKIRSTKTNRIFDKFLKIVKKEKIDYFVCSGSLLPIFRKQELATQSDVDLYVDGYKLKLLFKKFKNFKNVKIYKKFSDEKKHLITKIIIKSVEKNQYSEPALIDITGYFNKNKKIYYFLNGNIKSDLPNKHFLRYEYTRYQNRLIRTPFKVKEYLKNLYGKNWIKPNDYFTDNTEIEII